MTQTPTRRSSATLDDAKAVVASLSASLLGQAADLLGRLSWAEFVDSNPRGCSLDWDYFLMALPGHPDAEADEGAAALRNALRADPDWRRDARRAFAEGCSAPQGPLSGELVLGILGAPLDARHKRFATHLASCCIHQMDAEWQRLAARHGFFSLLDDEGRAAVLESWAGDDFDFGAYPAQEPGGRAAHRENARQLFAQGFLDARHAPAAISKRLLQTPGGREKGNSSQWAIAVHCCLEALGEQAPLDPSWDAWMAALRAKPADIPAWREALSFAMVLDDQAQLGRAVFQPPADKGEARAPSEPNKAQRSALRRPAL